jgi:hypothetical protein
MPKIGVHGLSGKKRNRFAIRAHRPVETCPSVSDFRTGEHTGERGLASLYAASHPGVSSADSFGNVEDAAFGVPPLS